MCRGLISLVPRAIFVKKIRLSLKDKRCAGNEVVGLAQLELSLKPSVIGMDTYLNNTDDWMLNLVENTDKISACTLLLVMRKNI